MSHAESHADRPLVIGQTPSKKCNASALWPQMGTSSKIDASMSIPSYRNKNLERIIIITRPAGGPVNTFACEVGTDPKNEKNITCLLISDPMNLVLSLFVQAEK